MKGIKSLDCAKLIKVILANILICSILIIAAEVYLQFRHKPRNTVRFEKISSINSKFLFHAKGNQDFDYAGNPSHINDVGFRRRTSVSAGKFIQGERIFSYGDSIGFGYRIGDEQHYPYLVEKYLNEHSSVLHEVVNTSKGASPSIYSFHLREDLPRYRPDKVIVSIELLNDLGDEAVTVTSGKDQYGLPVSINRARYLIGFRGDLLSNISFGLGEIERSLLYVKISRKIGWLLTAISDNPLFSDSSTEYYYNVGFDRYLLTRNRLAESFTQLFDSLSAMQKYSLANGADFILIVLPSKYAFDGKYVLSARGLVQQAESEANKRNIPVISLIDEFDKSGGKRLFKDFCHPTAKGYELIARTVSEWLLKRENSE